MHREGSSPAATGDGRPDANKIWEFRPNVSKTKLLRSFGLALAAEFAVAGTAFAHHPTIEARAYWDTSDYNYYIDYTSTSRCTGSPAGSGCGNAKIESFISGTKVDEGAHVPSGHFFSGGPFPALE